MEGHGGGVRDFGFILAGLFTGWLIAMAAALLIVVAFHPSDIWSFLIGLVFGAAGSQAGALIGLRWAA